MILIIDNYDSFTYNIYQIVCEIDPKVIVLRNDEVSITMIKQLCPDGIILSPGPGKPEDAGTCVEIIKNYSGEVPILGVCLGHQAIAVAFGGDIIKSNEILHGKASNIFHNHSSIYKNIKLPFRAGRYHSLIVDKKSLPKQLNIDAESYDEIIMGISHHNHPTFGVQFHPESILTESGIKIINNFVELCKENKEEK